MWYLLVAAVICTLFSSTFSQTGEAGQIKFSSPQLSDEEMHSSFVPANMKCDACKAVSHQLADRLRKAEKKKSKKKLIESDYLEAIEGVCEDTKNWDNYGLKQVEGVNRISGPGTDAADVPGMMQGGGKWPSRLMDKCFSLVDEVGEDQLYDFYHKTKTTDGILCSKAYRGDKADCPKLEMDKKIKQRLEL